MPLVTTPIPGCGDGLQVQKGKKGWLKRSVTCFLPVLCPTSFHSFPPPEGSHIGSFARLTDTFPVWKRPQRDIPRHNHRAQRNQCEMVVWGAVRWKKLMPSYFSMEGAGGQLTGTCLDSCARAEHSSPSTDANTHAVVLLNATIHLKKYTETKYWERLLTHPLPPRNMCTCIPNDIPFPLPTCQGSQLYTHAHVFRLTYKHMWAWLESSGSLTNGMVFIFCLWHGSGNDSIIVLSAQHSLPISIRRTTLQLATHASRTNKDTHTHTQTSSEECSSFQCIHSSYLPLRHLLCDPICYFAYKNVAGSDTLNKAAVCYY